MELGHDDFRRRNALFLVNANRNATTVISHGNRRIRMDFDVHIVRMTSQRFVDAIVNHLIDHMVQT